MIKHLLVILDYNSTSFCYYPNSSSALATSHLISIKKLNEIVNYISQNHLTAHFILGFERLPKEYETIIEKVNHVKIVPFCLKDIYKDAIVVVNDQDLPSISGFENDNQRIIILRLEKTRLTKLCDYIIFLFDKCKKVNLYWLGIENFTNEDLKQYKAQLDKLGPIILNEYQLGCYTELNILSDRLLLKEMNNCDAGLQHLTVAPNGQLYICPGFYYSNEDSALGSITQEFEIRNSHLLRLDHAPICRRCDAYHCKRCLYLNKKTTLEVNTPSRQQCVLSHYERETSRFLQENLSSSSNDNILKIPAISYLDPFESVIREGRKINLPEDDFENLNSKELLLKIYELQKEILEKLNK